MSDSIPKVSRSLLGVLLLSMLVRAAVVVWQFDELEVDRDNYLAIGHNLAEAFEFCSISGSPTAHRPPLYPWLIAACYLLGGTVAIGVVQILLGTATVWLTSWLAHELGLGRRIQLIAAFIVAFDPLLVQYTSRAMTETLCVFLTTALLVAITRLRGTASRTCIPACLRTGALFGLVTLCRPGMWAFGFLAGFVWLIRLLSRSRKPELSASSLPGNTESKCSEEASRPTTRTSMKRAAVFVAGVVVVVTPWTIRNCLVFGRPIVMTTHGGYTLLLGNNSEFYEEVVSRSDDSVWSFESLTRWQDSIRKQADASGIDWNDEVARDRFLAGEARLWMTDHPAEFAEACLLRLRRFWALRPATGRSSLGTTLVGMWYAGVFALASAGAFCRWRLFCRNTEGPLLILSLVLLHSVYWSNARM